MFENSYLQSEWQPSGHSGKVRALNITESHSWSFLNVIFSSSSYILGSLFSLVNIGILGFCSVVTHLFKGLVLIFRGIEGFFYVLDSLVHANVSFISMAITTLDNFKNALFHGLQFSAHYIGDAFYSVFSALKWLPKLLEEQMSNGWQNVQIATTQFYNYAIGNMVLLQDLMLYSGSSLANALAEVPVLTKAAFYSLFQAIINILGIIFSPFHMTIIFLYQQFLRLCIMIWNPISNVLGFVSIENASYICRKVLLFFTYFGTALRDVLLRICFIPWNISFYLVELAINTSLHTYLTILVLSFLTIGTIFVVITVLNGQCFNLAKYVIGAIKGIIHSKKQLYARDEDCLYQKNEDEPVCVICQDQPKNIVLMPCRHLCLCTICLRQLQQSRLNRRLCPICRTMIRSWIEVYA